MSPAYRITLSPHEWTWTQAEQEEMARDVQKLLTENDKFRKALNKIARYDEESIWMDDRDDAAYGMLAVARVALGLQEFEEE
jgi:hypothetical protein